jgi:acylphosphatase
VSDKLTKHIRVFGRVQGVGYRNWTVATAKIMNLTGWVRNRKDGTVEIVACGQSGEMKRFIDACHKGPSNAKVETLRILDGIDEDFKEFEQSETF